jgi:putative heme-binding domain-containing protein
MRRWSFFVARSLVALACLFLLAAPSTLRAQDPPSAVGPLMKLYRSGRLPAERQPTVVEMICDRGNEHDLRFVFDKVLETGAMSPELRLKAMAGLTSAAQGRSAKPAGDLSALATLLETDDPKLRLAAMRLAAACGVDAVTPALQKIATDRASDPELQRAAIAGLISIGGDANREVLVTLAEAGPSTAIRMQAAAGLVGTDVDLAARLAATILAAATPQDDPGPLLDAFFVRKDGADQLALALRGVTLSVDVAKRALRTMYSVGRSDAALSDVLSVAAGVATDVPPPTPEELAAIVQDVADKGNAARGEQIFRRADVSCMRCHSVSRAGGQVGPDLSAVGGSSPADYIANSILNPNLAVKEQYVTRVFETSDGLVLSGVLIDRDENRIRIRDSQGKVIEIPASEVETEAEGPTMMPTGLTKFLTRDELIDLIRFVSELGKPGDFAVQTVPTMQRWRVMTNPPAELTGAVPHLEFIRELVLGSPDEAWAPAYGKVAGWLPLAELATKPDAKAVILKGEIQVNEAGPITVKIDTTQPTQVWIDAQPYLDQKEFTTTLEPGRHAILLRVERTSETAPELRVQFTKPTDSKAQFEVVGGA